MTLRELLNTARWKEQRLHAWTVEVLHRGAPDNRRTLEGSRIAKVVAAGIEVYGAESDSDTVFIPYHRFLAIRGSKAQLVWAKGQGVQDGGLATEAAAHPTAASAGTSAQLGAEVRSDVQVVLDRAPVLLIDGSAGEGGGQILRTSLTLAMLTGTPFVIDKIRAGRRKPGLMRQHLTCVQAAADLCGAVVTGAKLRSTRLEFRPGAIKAGRHSYTIGTAGSVCLVLQTVALPLALAPVASELTISGGTHARWAPPFPFLEAAWVPIVQRMGAALSVELRSAGFYPAGGGKVVLRAGGEEAAPLRGLYLAEAPGELELELTAVVSNLSEGIARRELVAACELLGAVPLKKRSQTLRSPGPGNAIWLEARGTQVTNLFTAIGERGTRAEDVGMEVASQFLAWRESRTSVDEHLADQLMVPMAMAGEGSFTTGPLTKHSWTNLEVIAAFTGRRILVHDLGDHRFRLSLTAGAG